VLLSNNYVPRSTFTTQ